MPIRLIAFFGMLAAAALGLASRMTVLKEVPILGEYGGDACWAMAAYALVRICAPKASIQTVALIAAALSLAVELSQLVDVAWLNNLRQHTFVKLLIGHGFLWSDLVAYAVGIAIAAMVELLMSQAAHAKSASEHDQ